LLAQNVAEGRLRATAGTASAIRETDVSLLCVGTPSRRNGGPISYLEAADGGRAIADKSAYHVVVVRSFVLPGTTHEMVTRARRRFRQDLRRGLGVSTTRSSAGGTAQGFRRPPLTLVGHNHAADAAGTSICPFRRSAAHQHQHPRGRDDECTSNTWHALKVVFANEIGNPARS
jgi:GDP-mannose 6-dehydrogenase